MAEAANVQARHFARAAAPEYQLGWLIGVSLALAYIVLLAQTSSLPMQDMPNHLARAVAMADLIFHHGAHFGAVFNYQAMPIPYLLPDLGFAVLVELFGPTTAGVVWNVVSFLSLPAAMVFYTRVQRFTPDAQAFAFLISLYLGSDWFFLMGFVSFRFAIALTLVGLGIAQLLRRNWSWARFATLCLIAVAGYSVHLTAVLFLGICIGVSGFVRLLAKRTTLRTELLLLSPLVALLAWHFIIASGYLHTADKSVNPYRWGSVRQKIQGLFFSHWSRYSERVDFLMMIIAGLCVLWPVRKRLSIEGIKQLAVLEMLAIVAVLVAMYFVLPFSYSEATYVEDRPLGMVFPCLLIACLSLPPRASEPRTAYSTPAFGFVSVLLVLNLLGLGKHLLKDNTWLENYREIVAAVPPGARVLPINTLKKDGRISPWLHAGSYAVVDRAAIVPILFSANRGDVMKYFRYRDRAYAPRESWYFDARQNVIDWESVACDYQFILISKPFDAERIPFAPFVVTENNTAALLSVDSRGCPATLRNRAVER